MASKFRPLFILSVFLLIVTPLVAQSANGWRYDGFSGGMMLHSGYVWGSDFVAPIGGVESRKSMTGVPTGIGGVIRFHFANGWRIGSEGYRSVVRYDSHGSFAALGWGGVLVDHSFNRNGRLKPFVGLTVGGGVTKNTAFAAPRAGDGEWDNASFSRSSSFVVAPFAGIECAMSEKLNLIVKADRVFEAANPQPDFPKGVRLYIGIIFRRGN